MKKTADNRSKKKYIITGLTAILTCLIIIFAIKILPTREAESTGSEMSSMEDGQDIKVAASDNSQDQSGEEESSWDLPDYDDLKDNEIRSEDIKDKDNKPYVSGTQENDTTNVSDENGSNPNKNKNEDSTEDIVNDVSDDDQPADISDDKVMTIDESDQTIKDETIHEYQGETGSSGGIKFFDVKPETGKDVDGNVDAGGKQDVGSWN